MATPRRLLVPLALLASLTLAPTTASAAADRDCGDFGSQKAAQIFFLNNGGPSSDPHALDSDGDGIACESNPAPYYYGTSLPDEPKSDPKPEPKPVIVKSSVDLDLSVDKAIRGEKVKLSATVSPRATRTVVFQRRADGRWKTFDRETSNSRGLASFALRAPRSATTYRALVVKKTVANKVYTAATSKQRDLRIQQQRVTLTLTTHSVSGPETAVGATAIASPVRRGRPVALQSFRAGEWRTIAQGRQNKRGRTSFTIVEDTVGTHRYRAQVQPWHGAASLRSDQEQLTVRDTTAPAVPTNLVATAGDATVQLTWDQVQAEDLHYYRVWVRQTADGAWTELSVTTSPSFTATGLTNESTYWFAVQAVDRTGNSSGYSIEATATPTTPPAPPVE